MTVFDDDLHNHEPELDSQSVDNSNNTNIINGSEQMENREGNEIVYKNETTSINKNKNKNHSTLGSLQNPESTSGSIISNLSSKLSNLSSKLFESSATAVKIETARKENIDQRDFNSGNKNEAKHHDNSNNINSNKEENHVSNNRNISDDKGTSKYSNSNEKNSNSKQEQQHQIKATSGKIEGGKGGNQETEARKIYTRDNILLKDDDALLMASSDSESNSFNHQTHQEQQNRLQFEANLSTQLLEETEESLKELYEIHDYYFTADKEEKLEMLKERCHKVLVAIDKIQQEYPTVYEHLSSTKRGRLAYIQGRAFDVFESYNIEAETALTRAVKLNPTDIDAWNGLAHCFWKKQDFSSAYDCYKQALENENNKVSHREFSKLLRQLPVQNNVEAANNVRESLVHAKAAIKLDLLDPESWFVLGNAHLSLFFKVSPNLDDLNRALQAYGRAEANGGDYNPDLFFNRANVLRYKENLDEALKNYVKANELDPSFNCLETVADIRRSTLRTIQLIDKKGGLRPKRLKELCESLHKVPGNKILRELGDTCRPIKIKDLSYDLGSAKNRYLHLKKIIPLGQQNVPPQSLLVTDVDGDVCVLSIYHLDELAVSKFTEKDIITILHPCKTKVSCSGVGFHDRKTPVNKHNNNLSSIPSSSSASSSQSFPPPSALSAISPSESSVSSSSSFVHEQGTVNYDTIHLDHPRSMLVNGKPLKPNLFSPAQIKLDAFDK